MNCNTCGKEKKEKEEISNNLSTNVVEPCFQEYKQDHQIYELIVITNKNKYSLTIQTKKKYKEIDITKSEKEIMTELGYDRIWDCGLLKYRLTLK